jgi:hypothetical protein
LLFHFSNSSFALTLIGRHTHTNLLLVSL